MPSLDLCLVAHVVRGDAWMTLLDEGIGPDLLFDAGKEALKFVRAHFSAHGKLPEAETVEADTGVAVPELADVPEPASYYIARVRRRALDNLAVEATKKQVTALDQDDVDGALEAARELLATISAKNLTGEPVGDWTRSVDRRLAEYAQIKGHPGGLTGVPTPWPGLNELTQGMNPGDLWILAARLGRGKTWFLLKMAVEAWLAQANPLIVSMEMPRERIERRLDAIWAKVPYKALRRGLLGIHAEDHYTESLESLRAAAPLHIVTRKRVKTPQDIGILVEQLNPGVVLVDGFYKMRPSGGAKFRAHWERMVDLIDELQEFAQDKSVPVLVSTQFNREQTRKSGKGRKKESKGDDDAGVEDLAFSDAIAMNADVVLALLWPDDLRAADEICLKLLKNREDERKAWSMKFDLESMEFDETGEWGGSARRSDDDDQGAAVSY